MGVYRGRIDEVCWERGVDFDEVIRSMHSTGLLIKGLGDFWNIFSTGLQKPSGEN